MISTIGAAGLLVGMMVIHGQMPRTTDGPGGLAVILFEWPVALMAAVACLIALGTAVAAFRSSPLVNAAVFAVDAGIAFLLFGYTTNPPTWQQAARYFSAEHQSETREREAVDYRELRAKQLDRALNRGSRFTLQAGPGANVRFLSGSAQADRLDGSISASNAGPVHADFSLDAEIRDAAVASPGFPPGESTLRFKVNGVLDSQMLDDIDVPITQDFGNGIVRELQTKIHVWWQAAAENQQVSVSFRMPATESGDSLPARRASTYMITIVPTREAKSALDQWKCNGPSC